MEGRCRRRKISRDTCSWPSWMQLAAAAGRGACHLDAVLPGRLLLVVRGGCGMLHWQESCDAGGHARRQGMSGCSDAGRSRPVAHALPATCWPVRALLLDSFRPLPLRRLHTARCPAEQQTSEIMLECDALAGGRHGVFLPLVALVGGQLGPLHLPARLKEPAQAPAHRLQTQHLLLFFRPQGRDWRPGRVDQNAERGMTVTAAARAAALTAPHPFPGGVRVYGAALMVGRQHMQC